MTEELHDVQGLVVSGYGDKDHARYLLLELGDAAAVRAWLAAVADRVTASVAPQAQHCLNLALTPAGLSALGLQPAELRTFPVPFREGMTATHRRRVLGDVGPSSPDRWAWGGTEGGAGHDRIHALLLLFAPDAASIVALEAEEEEAMRAAGIEVVHRLTPEPLPGRLNVGKFGVEHFGFADGMSQPVLRGFGHDDGISGDERRRSVIEPGEVVLGHPNGYGERAPWPRLDGRGEDGERFGRNGTYLVVRQLAQDVAGFWRLLDERTRASDGTPDPERAVWLASKLVGRWPSGAPLVWAHHRDDLDLGTENGFGYAGVDPHGERCPVGAHIRRANPRDSLGSDPDEALRLANLHRIVRRGRVYGPAPDDVRRPDGVDRGLFFLCLNANIERQFEFIQHTWSNNPKFGGLYDEADPLLGNAEGGGRFTVQGAPVRARFADLPSFVTVHGGAYFFLPGITALRTLAGGRS